jgi:hypothetical protein
LDLKLGVHDGRRVKRSGHFDGLGCGAERCGCIARTTLAARLLRLNDLVGRQGDGNVS